MPPRKRSLVRVAPSGLMQALREVRADEFGGTELSDQLRR
jgi:hypothetical protein